MHETSLDLNFTSIITDWSFSLPSSFTVSNAQLLQLHAFLPVTSPSISEVQKSITKLWAPTLTPGLRQASFLLQGGQTIPDPAQNCSGRGSPYQAESLVVLNVLDTSKAAKGANAHSALHIVQLQHLWSNTQHAEAIGGFMICWSQKRNPA